ncbi:HET-domain-containing protein [Dendrothele bispora CBS 962.96]|uniref:HET-domain-containing protein n=1 Tax=Dendrothele bispora (strain CBS 962.96) TaxID=1314807 RepID=A0A4V4HG87_DENBC|nr:HET-domain-containing protein [Dendrothele bispora CBS 962.96]
MRFSIGKFFSRKYSSRPENVSQPEKACPQPEKACSQPEKACSQPEKTCPRRLIDTRTLNLVDLNEGDPVPPYAILSHRWIQGQEISYQEFLDGDEETRSKSGYLKIAAACVTACEDKINFIWVDTCCIDKGSHEDVVRNIRSMYAYYRNARVCYAHLADMKLLVTDGMKIDEMWRKRFLHSEWFKRGWTLQELLAPKKVVFFDQSWVPVGTKQSLKEMISYVTNIPSARLEPAASVRL